MDEENIPPSQEKINKEKHKEKMTETDENLEKNEVQPIPDSELKKDFEDKREQINTERTQDEKIWSVISYLSFFCIIPLLAKRENVFIQFHARQGLVLAIIFTLLGPLYFIRAVFPFLGFIHFVIIIAAAVQAFSGRWWKIPGVYDLSKKLNL